MAKKSGFKPKKLPPKKLQYELLKVFRRQPKKRLNAKQLIKKLKLHNSSHSVKEALAQLYADDKIIHVKDGRYRYRHNGGVMKEEVYQGYVDLTKSGAAYIICDKLDKDVYVPAKRTLLALHGDQVLVSVIRRMGKRAEGRIVKILKRSTEQFIGRFQVNKHFGFVIPNSRMVPFDIYVYPKDQLEAEEGDLVKVKVMEWPKGRNQSPIGTITSILDKSDRHEVRMQSILLNQGFDVDFPEVVEKAAEKLSRKISDEEIEKRRDFRGVPTFTIDPLTAKDFDDAISYRRLGNGNTEVGIHIADVTHYVTPDSVIDKEAYKRSTSVYLVDRVAPMLPEILSNELCSLRPDEDSLTFSAVFEFDRSLQVQSRWFGKTIIHSQKRFTYEEAQEILDQNRGTFHAELIGLQQIASNLRHEKFAHGAIAFEAPELQFELDEDNHPVSIFEKKRLEAHMLIEDLMLLANREAAFFMARKSETEVPFVYRIHDAPDPQKIADFSYFLSELDFTFSHQTSGQIRASFNRLSQAAQSNEVLALVEPLAVRTMAKAIYSTDNIGHFGLAFDHYTHFTSPIRRYSDVLVHRILWKNLHDEYRSDKAKLEAKCMHISNQERKAQEAERDSVKFKQMEFIADYIGHTFTGMISGFIDFGIFVSLTDSRIDGLVSFETLEEPFVIAENRMKATGRYSKKSIKLGDHILVRVLQVHPEEKKVDLEWISDPAKK